MDNKFQDKYRIESTRLSGYDYGTPGLYFITICTHMHESYFGGIKNMEMDFSELGKIAVRNWLEIPVQYPFVSLHEFIVMPNHVHGIIEICDIAKVDEDNDNINNSVCRDAINRISTNTTKTKDENKKPRGGITGIHNPMLHKNLARIIRWYKGRTTFECRKFSQLFAWQARYHDHIIRNQKEYYRISNYIKSNVANWNVDTFFKV